MQPTPIPTHVTDFLAALRREVRGDVRTDDLNRILYSTDASIYQVLPYGVLIPETVRDVQAAVNLAAKHQVPILPRTGGSSLAGQAVGEALVIDFSRYLDAVLEVNQEEGWARVQPGIVLDELNLHLRQFGLQFGPDPASSQRACLGGIVSNNSTGAHSIAYGMTADHVLAANVLLSDGTEARFEPLSGSALSDRLAQPGLEGAVYREVDAIRREGAGVIRAGTPRHWRRCGGYNLDRFIEGNSFLWPQDTRFNLAKLVCGAEGTLAVLTEIKLNLVPRPTRTALAIIPFAALREALAAVPAILEVGPTAVELLDNLGLTLCREVPEYARLLETFVEGNPNCVLITEFTGESEAELQAKVSRLGTHLRSQNVPAGEILPAFAPQLQANVWKVRKVGLGLLMSIKGDYKPIPFIEDAAVPVEHLADYVTRVEQFCHDLGTKVAYYAHASAGCIHIRPLVNTKLAEEVAKLPEITRHAAELLADYGGSLSSEHGDGRARSWLNEHFFGPELYGLYRRVKQVFDPDNILNPGNVVDAGPMTENLRFGAAYEVIPVQATLDFSADGGFHRAIEMCNGAGVCRKRTVDTMCPSFQVTREEEHSTRGRANALRAALSGHLPAGSFTSERMKEVMALCVSCKACKAECPSSVDMAKIKTEFLAQYYEANGTPLSKRLFGHIATLNRLGSGAMAPLANWAVSFGPARAVMEKTLGISQTRSLPPFARKPFTDWFEKRGRVSGQSPVGGDHGASSSLTRSRPRVVLFNDTFNTHNEPHIAIAAVEFLEAAGFEIVLPGHKCCGRPMISQGLVADARRAADETLARLAPLAEQGLPIVGLEPSCLLTLRDEYFDLLPGDPRVALVAEQAVTFEEFVAGLAGQGALNVTFGGPPRELLLHGHCHQKALVGTVPSHAALTLPPGYAVREVDSGCCGMAGAFGYEAEHQQWSLAMGERRLMPAVRAAGDETLVVAAGTSCRHQIAHMTGRRAYHPAEVLRLALEES
jgi:FAD/FMN-containing dehydrogenase/Fe-S oxidoreductase